MFATVETYFTKIRSAIIINLTQHYSTIEFLPQWYESELKTDSEIVGIIIFGG